MDIHNQQLVEVAELALRVGRERQELLSSMKAAFLAGDEVTALALARRLCGLEGKMTGMPEET